jgi:hypothetical protein
MKKKREVPAIYDFQLFDVAHLNALNIKENHAVFAEARTAENDTWITPLGKECTFDKQLMCTRWLC